MPCRGDSEVVWTGKRDLNYEDCDFGTEQRG